MGLFVLWYLLIGFLLGNGMPHFVFGVAGEVFRFPFGAESSPAVNVAWGLVNFLAATVLLWWRSASRSVSRADVGFLLLGHWLAVAMFGLAIEQFLS
jgi:hypothetical protein